MSAHQGQTDPTAVTGRRIIAFIIDLVIWTAIYGGVFFALADSADADLATCSGTCATVNDTVYGLDGSNVAIFYAVYWGYALLVLVLLQGISGITPGKLLLGLRTVDANGDAPGILKAFLRWLLLLIDFGLCFLIGLILVFTTKGHRRLGDMLAKTHVVGKGNAGSPVVIPGAEAVVAAPAYAATPGGAPPPMAPPAAGPPPAAEPAPTTGTDAQWDPARNAYIQWDPAQQQWLQFDDATQQWRPIDQ